MRWLGTAGRFLAELGRAQHRDKLHLHAAALAYTTLFSFVPLLTVALVTVGRVQPERAELVVRAIATVFPFSPARVQATLAAFAERTASLGWLAIVLSVVVIFNAFYQIEEVVNTIWGVPRSRRWQIRFFSFATILVCGPLLLGALFSALYWLSSRRWYPSIIYLARPLPALLAMLVLGLLYRWVPHTRVPWRAAWTGAAVAACGLTVLHLGFQSYLGLASDLNVIYGSLALVLFFLISLYLFWLALLLGAEASWVVGHVPPRQPENANPVLELLADLLPAQSLPVATVERRLGESSEEVLTRLTTEPPILLRSGGRVRLAREPEAITLGEVRERVGAGTVPDLDALTLASFAKHLAGKDEPAVASLATVHDDARP
ncbi:MAG TPA: YihY/virulence factor BrkB family protein [Thermoanaerobaculaceae bacterium]|nr:YihY/virulence factor BrkB family protein [Thermoanaerobaculaceae bacterium]HPS77704.1 YihY/virulence factor BrkB family protein [Thermoanaerobaculaceae bacterium]